MKSYYTNKIGVPQQLAVIQTVVNEAVVEGEKVITEAPAAERKRVAAKFFMELLDKLINAIEDEVEDGAVKKATVLVAFMAAYDLLAKTFIPIWLAPVNMVFRYALNVIIVPQFIDWIVGKYNSSRWGTDGI